MGLLLRQKAKDHCTIVLEGGYNLHNPQLAHTLINALEGEENPFIESFSTARTLSSERQVNKEMAAKLKELKGNLKPFHNLR